MSAVLSPFGSGTGDPYGLKLSLKAAPFPIEMINNITLGLSAGFIIAELVRPNGSPVTNLGLFLGTAGVTPNGTNTMALLDASGNLLGTTGDQSTAWSTGGNNGLYLEAAITGGPISVVTSSNYYVAVLSHMATPPQIGGFFAGGGVSYPTVKTNKPVIADGGHANFPSQLNISTAAVGNGGYWLVGS